jgi:hypothetical protein
MFTKGFILSTSNNVYFKNLTESLDITVTEPENLIRTVAVVGDLELSSDNISWAQAIQVDFTQSFMQQVFVRPLSSAGSGTITVEELKA